MSVENVPPGARMLARLPAALQCAGEIRARLAGKQLAAFLDYDGTLTPIVADHTQAFLSEAMRAAVARLGRSGVVAIVSGRDLGMLRDLVGLDNVYYAGSHGFEIAAPGAGGVRLEMGVEFLPELDAAERALRARLTGVEGHSVERKRFSVAVHYRRVAAADLDRLDAVVADVLAAHPRLRRGLGKKVYELRPAIDWDKGRAVLWLLERLGLARPEVVPVYVGDDITDEDAFRAVAGRGLGIVVRDGEVRQSAAEYALDGVREVAALLELLAAIASEAKQRDSTW